MEEFEGGAAPAGQALELEQARDVGRGHDLGPRALVVRQPVEAHAAGDRFLLDREEPAEAAALVAARELDELEAGEGPEAAGARDRGGRARGTRSAARGGAPGARGSSRGGRRAGGSGPTRPRSASVSTRNSQSSRVLLAVCSAWLPGTSWGRWRRTFAAQLPEGVTTTS